MSKLCVFLLLTCCQFTTLAQSAPTDSTRRDPITVEARPGKTFVSQSEPAMRHYTGVVKVHHLGTVIFCDRAIHQLTTNTVSAAGHVLLVQGDSITIKSDSLLYNGANRQVTLVGQVLFQTGNSILTATRIEYDLLSGIARYSGKGRLVTGRTILNSTTGSYSARTRQFITSPPPNAAPNLASVHTDIPEPELAFVTVPMQTVSEVIDPDRPPIANSKTRRLARQKSVVARQPQSSRPVVPASTTISDSLTIQPYPANQALSLLATTGRKQITAANESKESTASYMKRTRSLQQTVQSARTLPPSTAGSVADESDLERLLNRKKQVY